MKKYNVEIELRTFYMVQVTAQNESEAGRIGLYNTEWQHEDNICDQAVGINSVNEVSVNEVSVNESVEGQANERDDGV